MNLNIPMIPVCILNEFTTKEISNQNFDCLMFKPGKEPGSVRVFATDGCNILEFYFASGLQGGDTFKPFSLNLSDVVKNSKIGKKSNPFMDILFSDLSSEVEIRTDLGLETTTKKREGVIDIDFIWNQLQSLSEKAPSDDWSKFSIPWKSYKNFFFEKYYPNVVPIFERYGQMTLVRYPVESMSFPPYPAQGISMQMSIVTSEEHRIDYSTDPKPYWV